MKICILLSGRVHHYSNLLKVIKKSSDNIHVFISVNDTYKPFYDKLRANFSNYLKGLHCEQYKMPQYFFHQNAYNYNLAKHCNEDKTKYVLSCYYNDKNAFQMATAYADANGFEYDIYLRFRSDLEVDELPIFDMRYKDGILFSVKPVHSNFILAVTDNPDLQFSFNDGRGYCIGNLRNHNKPVTSDISYGIRKAMSIYCSCYEYILTKNIEYKGNYFIWYEHSITMCLNDSGYPWELFDYNYTYVANRGLYEETN